MFKQRATRDGIGDVIYTQHGAAMAQRGVCVNGGRRVCDRRLRLRGALATFSLKLWHGDTACRSERAGVTCTNREGRGFFISGARQRIF